MFELNEHSFILSEVRHKIKGFMPDCGNLVNPEPDWYPGDWGRDRRNPQKTEPIRCGAGFSAVENREWEGHRQQKQILVGRRIPCCPTVVEEEVRSMVLSGRDLVGILAGGSAVFLYSFAVHKAAAEGPAEGGGSSATKGRDVVVEEVLERQRTHVPPPERVRRPSDSDLVTRMEFFDRDEIIRARQRILDFEKAAQEAIARGEEPPTFWQPYNPAVDRQDLGDSAPLSALPLVGVDPGAQDPANSPWPFLRHGDDGVVDASNAASVHTEIQSSRAPSIGASWEGPADTGRPSDSTVAVGFAHVGVMVNKELAFYHRDGTVAVGPIDFEVWWDDAPVPNDLYDPKIVYDNHEGHWIMVALNGRGGDPETYFAISVSQSPDPAGGWWTWYLRSDVDGSTDTAFWADHTRLGFDSGDATSSSTTGGGVYLVSNQYNASDSFQYTRLRVLRKYQLYTGSAVNWWDFWNRDNPDGSNVFMWSPAVTTTSTGTSPTEYMLNTKPGGGSQVFKWTVTNPLASGPTLSAGTAINVNSYSVPPAAEQSGGGSTQLIDTWDCRTQDVQYRGGMLYTAIGDAIDYGTPSNVEAVLHYWKIGSSTNTVYWDERWGLDDHYYFFPDIGVSAAGDATLVFSRSASTMFPQLRITGRLTSDTGLQGSSLVKSGEATYNPSGDTVERWGDWAGVGVDCSGDQDGAFFMNQYSTGQFSWSTWVGGSSFGEPLTTFLDDGESLFTTTEQHFIMDPASFDWAGAAMYNAVGSNHDLSISDSCPFGTADQTSSWSGETRDFIVLDGRDVSGFQQLRATNITGNVGYRVEARSEAVDVLVGSTAAESFASSEIMNLFEISLTSGKTYAAVVDILGGSADLDLWMFKGSRTYGRRGSNDGSSTASTAGSAGDETLVFTATESSIHGFAVTNENFGSSDYTFRVWLRPVVNSLGIYAASEGAIFTGPTPSLSEGTTPVTYSLDLGPNGATINAATGVVTWPSPTAGTYGVTVRASNPAGFDTEYYTIQVTGPFFADGFETGSTNAWSSTAP
jgi:hypothetical protein